MKQGQARRNPFAKLRYDAWRLALRVIAPIRPVFRLGLRVLMRRPEHVRGHVLPVNVRLEPTQQALSLDVLSHLIGRATVLAAMEECLCRRVGGCADYPVDLGCLVMGDAVERLHPGLGQRIDAQQALELVDRALACGLQPLVMHAMPDELLWSLDLEGMVTVCFCCPCCCFVQQAMGPPCHPVVSRGVTALPGVAALVDAQRCMGCGHCEGVCFLGAIAVGGGVATIDAQRCVACGRCAAVCSARAVSVTAPEPYDAQPVLEVYRRRTGGRVFPG